ILLQNPTARGRLDRNQISIVGTVVRSVSSQTKGLYQVGRFAAHNIIRFAGCALGVYKFLLCRFCLGNRLRLEREEALTTVVILLRQSLGCLQAGTFSYGVGVSRPSLMHIV